MNTQKYRSVGGLPIVVAPRAGIPRTRTYATVVGIRAQYRLGVHNNSLVNVLRGLTERVYTVERGGELVAPPTPEAQVFDELRSFGEKLVRTVGRANPWSYDEFVSSCRGSKRKLYEQAVASLQQTPLSRKDAQLRSFVKAENLDLEAKADPAPRMIQPRSPRYNAWVGRYIKAAEHRIYAAIDDIWGSETVMSGYNALDVARLLRKKWDRWHDTVAVGLDASRFDQHVSVEALKWEHGVYNGIYKDAQLARKLKWQLHNCGIALTDEGKVTYHVEGKRMSGDMNTSLGNKMIMCALVHEYCRQKGLTTELANNGDDCVVFMRKRSLNRFSAGLTEWFTRFGFTMKVEAPVDIFEQIEFCQQKPVNTGDRWLMTRSPHKGLAKDVTMIGVNPRDAVRDYHAWASGVGVAGLAAYGGMPVVQEVYKWMAGLGSKPKVVNEYSGLGAASKGMHGEYREPTPQCRASYYLAWGVTPLAQVLAEQQIRSATTSLTGPLSIDLVNHLSIVF